VPFLAKVTPQMLVIVLRAYVGTVAVEEVLDEVGVVIEMIEVDELLV
jgi:hypothetical protein